ncbi:metallophosphoesterase [Cellulomonas soli]|uniref:metallophosphoesterase family protein n=1 Tax=Cellulomonas soli TaxID=931535 RepID=UPI003F82CB5D
MTDPTSADPSGAAMPARRAGAALRRVRARGGQVLGALRERARGVRWGRTVLVGLVAVLVSVVTGVTTASVDMSLGPHTARYDVTTDATITVDLGPLGTLQIDSPLPLTLGVRATVQEIPDDLTEIDQATTLQALSGDLQTYLAFFTGPQATLTDVARALLLDAARRSFLTLVLLVGGWAAGRALLGEARRGELGARVRSYARPLIAGGTVVVVAATVLTSSSDQRHLADGSRPASAVFDGTPLEGARVTGRLGGVIDTYGGYVVDALRTNTEFYEAADAALTVQWEARAAAIAEQEERDALAGAPQGAAGPTPAPTGEPTTGPGDAPTGAAADQTSGEPADATAGEPAGAVAEVPTMAPAPQREQAEPVVLLVVSDLHCNVGMATVIGSLARLSAADVVLDAGDTTMNGTTVEQYCVTTFARAVPSGVPLVVSPGNHDSAETTAMYARAGATILDGHVVDVEGMRLLGDDDPNATRVGAGGTASRGESAAAMGERLADVACDAGDVDLLLIHTPAVGDAALDSGCVPAQISGHFHQRTDPEQIGLGVRYISASTAGATLGAATLGPLNGTAEMTVLRWDPTGRTFLDYQVVSVHTDASVEVTARLPWPVVELPAPAEPEGAQTPPGVAAGRLTPSPR